MLSLPLRHIKDSDIRINFESIVRSVSSIFSGSYVGNGIGQTFGVQFIPQIMFISSETGQTFISLLGVKQGDVIISTENPSFTVSVAASVNGRLYHYVGLA